MHEEYRPIYMYAFMCVATLLSTLVQLLMNTNI